MKNLLDFDCMRTMTQKSRLHVLTARLQVLALLGVLVSTTLSGCGDDPVPPEVVAIDDGLAGTDDAGLGDGLTTDGGADTGTPDDAFAATDAGSDSVDDTGGWTDADVPKLDILADTADAADATDAADAVACPGGFGCACVSDGDCPAFSACMESATGKVCAEPCQSGTACAPGTACVNLPGPNTASTDDDIPVCAPKFAHLCDPCTTSATCPSAGFEKVACIGLASAGTPTEPDGAAGWYCANFCLTDSDCPSDYTCAPANTVEGDTTNFCRPKTNTCACSVAAIAAKATTTCASSKVDGGATIGGCVGTRTCDVGGLTACSAPVATTETCDNVDNDCNGLTDDTAVCDDLNGCTTDSCTAGACTFEPTTAPCDDANACTSNDVCGASVCAGAAVVCDDQNPCTDDTCDPAIGCVFAPNTAACEDGDTCTKGDVCSAGQCNSGIASDCGCTQDSDCLNYEDGNACNGTLYCNKAAATPFCKINPATVIVCNPLGDTFCAVNTCDPGTGMCSYITQNAGAACEDGNACTGNDTCAAAACTGGPAIVCDDGNPCTIDSCNPASGCQAVPSAAACDDGNACTEDDSCATGSCVGAPKSCNDSYACTADSCDPVSGCVNAPVADLACQITSTYSEPFNCGSGALLLWQRSDVLLDNADTKWAFDASPTLPAPHSKACSLNINNGTDLTCGTDQTGINASTTTPSIDLQNMSAGTATLTTLYSAGDWGAGGVATIAVSVDGGAWTDIGTLQPSATWTKFSWPSTTLAGHKAQFRFTFVDTCGDAGKVGLFIDDFAVFEDLCTTKPGICGANAVCGLDQTGQLDCQVCGTGFLVQGAQCVDIDECVTGSAGCSPDATCANTPGSFSCTCKPGFTGDGKLCDDINECTNGTAKCAATATCTNTPGSFTCTCPAGQVGDGTTCGVLGASATSAAGSCLVIFQALPASKDGTYWLDFDGTAGPVAPAQYYCDMKNGGWTRLIYDDFENAQGGWSAGSTNGCGKYGKILGGYKQFGQGAAPYKTVNAPIHTQAKLWLQYIRLDSWDNEYGVVKIDGGQVWAKQGQANWTGGWNNKCGDFAYPDDEWDLGSGWVGPHSAASVTVTVTSTLDQGADDESFGMDNVVLFVK